MDLTTMLRKLRRSIASFAVVAIIASLSTASAVSAFSDVKESDWYFDNVQTLVDAGVLDGTKDKFNGGANLNRAEAAKIAVTAAGVAEEDLVSPETPSFSDVPKSLWAYKYIETAKSLGYVSGDAGKKTFRPGDNVNRAEFSKIIGLALELEENTDGGPHFSDVKSSDWFYSVVETAYNWSVVNGYEGGTFKPAAAINRAEMSKMTVAAMDPTAREDEPEETPETPVTPAPGVDCKVTPDAAGCKTPAPAVGGALNVALSSTPAAMTLPLGSKSVPVLQFSLTSDKDTVVDTLQFTRTGVGVAADFSLVYIYEGTSKLKSGKTISSDTNTVEFTGLNLTVKAKEPKVLTVKVDVAASGTATANDEHSFSLVKTTDVKSNATSVAGLPVTGNKFLIGGVSVGAVTAAIVSTISGPTLGQTNAECGNFKLTAGANDVQLAQINLTHGGTLSRSNMANFKLIQPGYTAEGITDGVIATAASINSNDRLAFVPATPFKISKNQNRNFEVRCDVTGGKTTDNIKFYLDEAGDALITDLQYNVGSNITNNFGTNNVTAVSLQGGKLTFADNGPNAQSYSTNSTSKKLFDFSVSAGRSVTVRDFWLLFEQTAWDNTSALRSGNGGATDVNACSISTAGAVTLQTDADDNNIAANDVLSITTGGSTYYVKVTSAATDTSAAANSVIGTLIYPSTTVGTTVNCANTDNFAEIFDGHLATRLKNVKLVDTETGGTLASSTNSNYAISYSDDFDISAGKTRKLSIVADLDTSLAANNAFKAGFDFNDTNYVRDNDANEFLAAADIVGGALFGKTMTAISSSLTVSLASTPVSETHVKGEQNVDGVGISAKAGDGGDVKVTRVNIRLMGDADGTFENSSGGVHANTLVTTASLFQVVGSTYTAIGTPVSMSLVGTIGSAGGYYRAQFSNLTHIIKKSETQKWVVRVNLSNTPTATQYLAIGLDANGASSDITAQDTDGNNVDPTGSDTLNIGTSPTVVKTVTTAGTIAVTEQSSPNVAILSAGTVDNVVSKFQWSATNEAFKVTKFDVILPEGTVASDPFDYNGDQAVNSTAARSIVKVKARYTNSAGLTEVKEGILSSGKANFTGLDLVINKNSTATMDLLVDTNTIAAGAVTGDGIRLGIYTGASTAGPGAYVFEAVGQGSSSTLTTVAPSNQANTPSMVLRKAQPIVAKATTGLPTNLANGVSKVYGFTVAANGGPVALKRVVFTVNGTFGAGGDQIGQFKLYRGTTDLSSQVSIFTKYGTNAETAADISGTGTSGYAETLTVTWDDTTSREETITTGTTNTYYLEANVSGSSTGDNLSINIADDTVQMAATAGVDEFKGTASSQGGAQVWRYSQVVSGDADCTNDFVYFDVNGDGSYAASADFAFAAAGTTEPTTCASAPGHNSYLGGVLRVGADANNANDNDTLYWDLDAGGTFTAASEVAIAAGGSGVSNDGALANNAAMTYALLYTNGTTLYFDVNANGANNDGTDYVITTSASTASGTANVEQTTANMNFVWSDQGEASGTTHATTTSAWTNGVNVDNLATQSLSLSF